LTFIVISITPQSSLLPFHIKTFALSFLYRR
jgi:hypothetical protein